MKDETTLLKKLEEFKLIKSVSDADKIKLETTGPLAHTDVDIDQAILLLNWVLN